MGWLSNYVGNHSKKRESKMMVGLQRNYGMTYWMNSLLNSRTRPFFAGDEPGIVDFAAYGYMKSISPFPQFAQLTDHANRHEMV